VHGLFLFFLCARILSLSLSLFSLCVTTSFFEVDLKRRAHARQIFVFVFLPSVRGLSLVVEGRKINADEGAEIVFVCGSERAQKKTNQRLTLQGKSRERERAEKFLYKYIAQYVLRGLYFLVCRRQGCLAQTTKCSKEAIHDGSRGGRFG
jgi:hypothetical protein